MGNSSGRPAGVSASALWLRLKGWDPGVPPTPQPSLWLPCGEIEVARRNDGTRRNKANESVSPGVDTKEAWHPETETPSE
jgi:hypothetical protein